MNDSPRARPGSSAGWDRARRAYVAMLGDDDPAAELRAAGALDLRLGYEPDEMDSSRRLLFSGPNDLSEVRAIVEQATGIGTWPRASPGDGALLRGRVELDRPAGLLGLMLAMDGLIERRSPWGRWRSMVDTMAARLAALDAVSVEIRVVEPAG